MVYTNTYRMLAPAPLGASLVSSRLRRDGHRVRLLDLMFAKDPAAEAARAAREFQPDLIGFSIRNVDSQSTMNYFDALPPTRSIVTAVQGAWPAPTLLGGTAFTTFPIQWMQALEADYGFAGDDVNTVSRFVASLETGRPDTSLPGMVYRADGAIRSNPFHICGYARTRFDGLDLIDYTPYRRSFSCFWEAGLVTRTGCPFGCIYCDVHRTYGRDYILRPPRLVAEEALQLQRQGVRSAFTADAGFNRPLEHAKEILEELIRTGSKLSLVSVFEPGEMDAEFARLYRRTGGTGVMTFATSLSDPVLECLHKPFTVQDALDGAGTLRAAGVQVFLYLTLGGPGDTPATIEESLRRAEAMRPFYLMMDHGFRVQPDTPLRDLAVAEGTIPPDDDCFRATFYHSPEVRPGELAAIVKAYEKKLRPPLPEMARWGLSMAWDKLRP